MFSRLSLKVCVAAAVLALAACASGPRIRTDGDPSADLTSYRTFGFFDRVSTDQGKYTTILTTRLRDATRRELERLGYQFSESNPQLLVNFHVNIADRTDVRSTPTGGFYGYRAGMYGAWAGYPQNIETVHYQEGTLAIDLVDAGKKQLVWQGIAEGRVSQSAVENPGPAIDQVVGDIFGKFPTAAH